MGNARTKDGNMVQQILDFMLGDFMLLVYILVVFVISTKILGKWLESFFVIELPNFDDEEK